LKDKFFKYVGYEIDPNRCRNAVLPPGAIMLNRCAFSDEITDADLCIGNPPFVRNQDLPTGWRQRAARILSRRAGIVISGLANAWQYFFLLSLVSVKDNGICALVIPYEWVSRPSAKTLRDYILAKHWNVSVYRLIDTTFASVLTTSSITIVDKSGRDGLWQYFEERADGSFVQLRSPSGAARGVVRYAKRSDTSKDKPRAVRGLSPGTQKILTLTEGERVRSGLSIGRDVVPCVTTLRHLPSEIQTLSSKVFAQFYREPGRKCWLIRTDRKPSRQLQAYLKSVPSSDYQTSTCLERDNWWEFKMPPIPKMLMAQCFRGPFPKVLKNTFEARAVGGVTNIFNVNQTQMSRLIAGLDGIDLRKRIVAHSNGLRKVEINQLNSLLAEAFHSRPRETV